MEAEWSLPQGPDEIMQLSGTELFQLLFTYSYPACASIVTLTSLVLPLMPPLLQYPLQFEQLEFMQLSVSRLSS